MWLPRKGFSATDGSCPDSPYGLRDRLPAGTCRIVVHGTGAYLYGLEILPRHREGSGVWFLYHIMSRLAGRGYGACACRYQECAGPWHSTEAGSCLCYISCLWGNILLPGLPPESSSCTVAPWASNRLRIRSIFWSSQQSVSALSQFLTDFSPLSSIMISYTSADGPGWPRNPMWQWCGCAPFRGLASCCRKNTGISPSW